MEQREKVLGEFGKNQQEIVRVKLQTWQNRRLLDIRVFYRKGELWLPGQKGLTIQLTQIAALREALEAAEREATAEGFLPVETSQGETPCN